MDDLTCRQAYMRDGDFEQFAVLMLAHQGHRSCAANLVALARLIPGLDQAMSNRDTWQCGVAIECTRLPCAFRMPSSTIPAVPFDAVDRECIMCSASMTANHQVLKFAESCEFAHTNPTRGDERVRLRPNCVLI